jgi:hypothetical protein
MQLTRDSKVLASALVLAFLLTGCATPPSETSQSTKSAAQATQQKQNVYTGSVVGKSNKAKTISISVGPEGQAQTMMVKFDDNTKGLNFAEQGEAAIISWEQRGDDQFATEIKPKLAKLPEGVTEIKVDELYALMEKGTAMTLVDARPESRYAQAHLPDAISVSVPKLKKMGEKALPKEKDKLLIFYCGGPT